MSHNQVVGKEGSAPKSQSLADMESYKCPKCEGLAFQLVFVIKGSSAILSSSGKNEYLPIQVFQCAKDGCGEISDIIVGG